MKRRLIVIATLVTAAAAGIAFATQEGDLRMTPAFARAEVAATVVPVATCVGADATYTVLHVTGQGPITSADPRLSGTEIVDAYILDNPNTGRGVSTDDFRIVDPVSGALKWRGTAWALDAQPGAIKSLALGELADGSKLAALATVYLPAPGSSDPIVIEYGGAGSGDSADRGLVISGDCAGVLKHMAFR